MQLPYYMANNAASSANLYVLGENKNDKHFSLGYRFISCSFQSKE